MNFNSMMPPDPFEGDPNDPASFLDEDEFVLPLSDQERAELELDLQLALECQKDLLAHGIRGICFMCPDCIEMHYFDWSMLIDNIQASLANNHPAPHEPSAEIDVTAYVPWDYAQGFLQGLKAARHA